MLCCFLCFSWRRRFIISFWHFLLLLSLNFVFVFLMSRVWCSHAVVLNFFQNGHIHFIPFCTAAKTTIKTGEPQQQQQTNHWVFFSSLFCLWCTSNTIDSKPFNHEDVWLCFCFAWMGQWNNGIIRLNFSKWIKWKYIYVCLDIDAGCAGYRAAGLESMPIAWLKPFSLKALTIKQKIYVYKTVICTSFQHHSVDITHHNINNNNNDNM